MEKIENFTTQLDSLRRNQVELLELKNTMIKLKDSIDEFKQW